MKREADQLAAVEEFLARNAAANAASQHKRSTEAMQVGHALPVCAEWHHQW
jgi:hypothetical protein